MSRHIYAHLALAALSLAGAAIILAAGPLNPPAGPVTSSYKTLTEVEPRTAISAANTPGDADSLYKITQPGSYYLTANITGVAGKHGIEIAASGVTLDLNGFALSGVNGMGAFDGVSVPTSGRSNIAIFNGTVSNWGDEGIDLGTAAPTNCRVERVLAIGNDGNGLRVGDASTVRDCSLSLNGASGLLTLDACTVTSCTAYLNSVTGFTVADECSLTSCTTYGNVQSGIIAGGRCSIVGCVSTFNSTHGFDVGSASMVIDCVANSNSNNGIQCDTKSSVRGNTCCFNGSGSGIGAGIDASGDDNRIEANNAADNDFGIYVHAAGNVITRNTCSGNNTNWVIVANNIFGAIIDRTSPASPIVVGNSAAGTMGSTDPNANFSY